MKVVSLGWGVQSFTLAAMSALGKLPSVDAALHADTTHEHNATYEFATRWTPWLEQRGVIVVTVVDQDTSVINTGVSIPAFTFNGQSNGQIRRQCTYDWKIAPMRWYMQAHRNNEQVELWIGISLDEVERMKPSDVQYIAHCWPLVDLRLTRHDCIRWLTQNGLEVPPKSSCVFCPYHDRRAWRDLKLRNGSDWAKAVEVDRAIRKVRPPYDLFIHSSRQPLEEVDLRSEEDCGQLSFLSECGGFCFV